MVGSIHVLSLGKKSIDLSLDDLIKYKTHILRLSFYVSRCNDRTFWIFFELIRANLQNCTPSERSQTERTRSSRIPLTRSPQNRPNGTGEKQVSRYPDRGSILTASGHKGTFWNGRSILYLMDIGPWYKGVTKFFKTHPVIT